MAKKYNEVEGSVKAPSIEEVARSKFAADHLREPGPGENLDPYRIKAIIERLEG